jgi:5,10-methenyltetrahydrofolate synthetase
MDIRMQKLKYREELRKEYAVRSLGLYKKNAVEQMAACALVTSSHYVLAYKPIVSLEVPFVDELSACFSEKVFYYPCIEGDKMCFYTVMGAVYDSTSAASGSTCVIVPSLGLTHDGKRLGKGGGYYDKFLAQNPHLVSYTTSCVPDFARLETLETEPFDVPIAVSLFCTAT